MIEDIINEIEVKYVRRVAKGNDYIFELIYVEKDGEEKLHSKKFYYEGIFGLYQIGFGAELVKYFDKSKKERENSYALRKYHKVMKKHKDGLLDFSESVFYKLE